MNRAINDWGLPDDALIKRSDPAVMLIWARILGVYPAKILLAVAVGEAAYQAVLDYLRS